MKNNVSEEGLKNIYDAQKRGRQTALRNMEERIRLYNENPKLCLGCNRPLAYEKKKNDFCCHRCYGLYKYGKKMIYPDETPDKYCLQCGKELVGRNKRSNIFCDKKCERLYKKLLKSKEKMISFNNGELSDERARNFFRKITDKICSICGLSEWNGLPIPLVVDHIDGNCDNNFPSNFRFVCCNCDAQLDTYKSKNKGNGRAYRRKKKEMLVI
jgi:hypothetical protein